MKFNFYDLFSLSRTTILSFKNFIINKLKGKVHLIIILKYLNYNKKLHTKYIFYLIANNIVNNMVNFS
jgi:hypothetical protein